MGRTLAFLVCMTALIAPLAYQHWQLQQAARRSIAHQPNTSRKEKP